MLIKFVAEYEAILQQGSPTKVQEVGQEREYWKGRIDFLLAAVGYCVGLGNVWRFPYLCYIHGGSAFLLPYIIMTIAAGLPVFFIELSVGQFTSQGPVTAWRMTPLLSGIGWASVMISAMVCVYYNVIIMHSLLYIFLSLTNIGWPVPWASCQNKWNDKLCLATALPDLDSFDTVSEKISHSIGIKNDSCVQKVSEELGIGSGKTQIEAEFFDNYPSFESNYSKCNIKYSLPAQQYFKRVFVTWEFPMLIVLTAVFSHWVFAFYANGLKFTEEINDSVNNFILELSDEEHIGSIGSLIGRNAMFLLIAWVVVFVCILRGPRSIAKVVYFTATYPLGVLLILLIRAVNTEGYTDGLEYYAVPNWDGLLDPGAWGAAAAQVMYTMGICFGGQVTFASFNRFNNNIFRDTLIVAAINAGSSIFAGFVTFALIGSIAHETNMPVRDLIGSGPELVFVIYPQGLSSLPSPAIWAFLYFLMVFTLGLDSQFGMMETIIVGVTDRFPDTVGVHRTKFVFVCCVVGFLLGLPLTTKGGIYILNMLNFYSASYAVMILGLLELIMIGWIYGAKNFVRDLELMLGKKHRVFWMYWMAMWLVITPLLIVLMFIMAMMSYKPAEYNKKVIPAWAEFLGWLMVLGPILCVVGRALKMLFYTKVPFKQALKPSKYYRPRHELGPDLEPAYAETTQEPEAARKNMEPVEQESEIREIENDSEPWYLNPINVDNAPNGTTEAIRDALHPQNNNVANLGKPPVVPNRGFKSKKPDDLPSPCHITSPKFPTDDGIENDNIFDNV